MIKMFIDNEEVVSNHEFTINEEILSASSTILNNCYPKSWELNQDYISKFYYPKDYSKFILANGEFEHGNSEYSILEESGSYPQFTTNIEREWNSLNIYGKTEQEQTTPNKNLLYINNVVSGSGLTITRYSNSEIVINGTSTTSGTITMPLYSQQLSNQPYALSGIVTGSISKEIDIDLNTANDLGIIIEGAGTFSQLSLTETTSSVITEMVLTFNSSTVFNNAHIKLQLEQNSHVTSYEESQLLIPSPENPSELISVGYKNLNFMPYKDGMSKTTNSLVFTVDDEGKVVVNGTPSANSYFYYHTHDATPYLNISKGIYFLNGCPEGGANNKYYIALRLYNNTTYVTSFYDYGAGAIVDTTSYDYNRILLFIYVNNGIVCDNLTFTAQITKGTQAHNYIPYGKYGIEVKSINGNGNLFDKSDVINAYLNTNGTTTANNTFRVSNFIRISGDYVTVSGNYGASENNCFYDENYNFVSYFNMGTVTSKTVSIPTNAKFLRVTVRNSVLDQYQVELGQEVTEYKQYESNSQLYLLDEPLRRINNIKDRLYLENNKVYVERDIGYISSYNGESILTDYMSTTGGLDNGASIQYVLNNPVIEELQNAPIPIAYNGTNNVVLDVNMETDFDLSYYWKNYDVIFAGIVKNSGDISLNPRYPHYCSLQILDYKTFLSESDTLDYVIDSKTIKEAIEMVVSSVNDYGFIVGDINISNADEIIGAYSTLNKTAYDVLQYLADISGSKWRARYIDSNTMAIDFYDPDTLPQKENIEYTKEYWEENNIVDLVFNYGTRDYRNKQIVLSNEVYGSIDYTEVLLSNGYNKTFITSENVGIVNSITINGVQKDVVSQKEKDLGVDADFYYTVGKNIIESATSYTAGTQIVINYTPLVKGRQIVYNDEEVTRIATQTDTLGVISRYENRNDIVSSKELQQIGETYIEYKGKPEVILTLTTQNKDLYNIGEVVYFDAPIPELKQKYMVKTKKTEYAVIKNVINLFYVYELTSSFNSEKAINYFDNQRNKAQGNIQEGESITRNIDINNSAVIIWDNSTVTEISIVVDGNNALNSVLNSPFIE